MLPAHILHSFATLPLISPKKKDGQLVSEQQAAPGQLSSKLCPFYVKLQSSRDRAAWRPTIDKAVYAWALMGCQWIYGKDSTSLWNLGLCPHLNHVKRLCFRTQYRTASRGNAMQIPEVCYCDMRSATPSPFFFSNAFHCDCCWIITTLYISKRNYELPFSVQTF